MRKSKIFLLICLFTIFLIPLIGSVRAQNIENYVGIKEGQTIVWKTEFDDGPYKDYLTDRYMSSGALTEEEIDEMAEFFFKVLIDWDFGEDTEAIKMIITEIKGEKEYETPIDTYYATKFIYYLYETKDLEKNDWDRDERHETGRIWKYDSRLYLDMIYFEKDAGDWDFEMGLYASDTQWFLDDVSTGVRWKNLFIVDNNVDWDELADKENEAREYWRSADSQPVDHFEGSADKEETQFFFTKKANGISTKSKWAVPSWMGELETITTYTDDGILLYYEWSYNGEPIMIIELEGAWLIENWWWIALIGASIGIVVIVVIILVIKKKKR